MECKGVPPPPPTYPTSIQSNDFNPQPQYYAPQPQPYAPQPQGYAPPPQGYAPPPQGYAPQPNYIPQGPIRAYQPVYAPPMILPPMVLNAGHHPANLTCPYCNKQVISNVIQNCNITIVIVLVLCFLPGLCCMPCCDDCYDTSHMCPSCGALITVKNAC